MPESTPPSASSAPEEEAPGIEAGAAPGLPEEPPPPTDEDWAPPEAEPLAWRDAPFSNPPEPPEPEGATAPAAPPVIARVERPAPVPVEKAPPKKYGRVPPQDVDAERGVLGAVLIDNEAIHIALGELDADSFYMGAHQLIFKAMTELAKEQQPVDTVTVSSRLRTEGNLDKIGGLSTLVLLSEFVPTAANIEHYAAIVRKKYMLRRLIEVSSEVAREAYGSTDAEGLVDAAEKRIFDLSTGRGAQGLVQINEPLRETFKRIEKLSAQKKAVTGVGTGIYELDKKTAGLQPSDLVIVAGRPSMGKTAFALGIALHAGTKDKHSVAVFSLEMSKESLVQRMLCSDGRIDATRMRTGALEGGDWGKLGSSAGRLSEAKIFIDDTGSISLMEVRSRCRRLAAEHGLDMIMIDYLQLMRGSPDAQSREQEISEISRGLKALAKDLNVPVVALSQLNRGVESRVDKRPGLADLRESGAIEQDADVIMFVYRDEAYNPETEHKGIAEIIIGKQRNGPIGTVHCRFIHQFTRFDNIAREDEVPRDL